MTSIVHCRTIIKYVFAISKKERVFTCQNLLSMNKMWTDSRLVVGKDKIFLV